MKFKVGDRVKIVDRIVRNGYIPHSFDIGDMGYVVSVDEDSSTKLNYEIKGDDRKIKCWCMEPELELAYMTKEDYLAKEIEELNKKIKDLEDENRKLLLENRYMEGQISTYDEVMDVLKSRG